MRTPLPGRLPLRSPAPRAALALLLSACGSNATGAGGSDGAGGSGGESGRPLSVESAVPGIIDPEGGSTIVVRGAGFGGADVVGVTIGGVPVTSFTVGADDVLTLISAPVAPSAGLDVEVTRADMSATLAGELESWSPTAIAGAQVFDARHGVTTGAANTQYEWQRLTPNMPDGWRVRDGNSLAWLPSSGRYWMIGGWNGEQAPYGFSPVPPDTIYPPLNTTDEVWSSVDGVEWRLDLPHGHGQFERRHSQNTVLWKDQLWMIGGDAHQGHYNHDVVSSPDGLAWTVRLGPATTPPPWSPRALQASGVYGGKLWTVGGQDSLGPADEHVYHNDVWSTEDGVEWTLVAPDAPGSDTRWAGCGALDGLVEFKGRLWLVGCARNREDAVGHSMSREVWSTVDGAVWTRHADPPWVGKIWPNVLVWDGRLWIMFGYTKGDPQNGWEQGNSKEIWYSDDGESWTSLPVDTPVPGSHAQGVAVRDDQILLAGGNYGFLANQQSDESVWRLVAKRGVEALDWTARGQSPLTVAAPDAAARPVLVADALGEGRPGLELDGSASYFALPEGTFEEHPMGMSVFWVARAPHHTVPVGWTRNYDLANTIVGGPVDGYPRTSVGLEQGQLVAMTRAEGTDPLGSPIFSDTHVDGDLQRGPGEARFAGVTQSADGTITLYVDGAGAAWGAAPFDLAPAWSRIGAGIDGPGEGAWNRFAGTLGAVVIAPGATDPTLIAKLHGWAQGRFGVR